MEACEVEPLEEIDLGDHADGVGELFGRGDHGLQRALSQRAVADLAACPEQRSGRASPVE